MPFGILIGEDGKPVCLCCRDTLWHCKPCWDKFHNSHDGKDYIPPEYYGQSMVSDEMNKKFEELGVAVIPLIKPDKNRHYKEGEYH